MVDFQLCSDLHIEMQGGLNAPASAYPVPKAPLLILAGDLYPAGAPEFTEILRRATEGFKLALFVPGNHEYYMSIGSMGALESMVAEKANSVSNVYCLNKQQVDIANYSFVGATMWTNVPKFKWEEAVKEFNDYRNILKSVNGSPLRPQDVCAIHRGHAKHLRAGVAAAKRSKKKGVVLVTHHAPDISLSAETSSRPEGLFPYYFASDMGDLCRDSFVKVWCHGHTHESRCLRLEPTGPVFACNSKGYPGEVTNYTDASVVRLS